jgi:hypothetical protein
MRLSIIGVCLFGALMASQVGHSQVSKSFYLYQDTDRDGVFDHRVHFQGDLASQLRTFETTATVDTCWQWVNINILYVTCGNAPPCPPGYSCWSTGSEAVGFVFDDPPCSCFAPGKQGRTAGLVYFASKQAGYYKRLPISAKEFENLLFEEFSVTDDGTKQRCDDEFSVTYDLWCSSDWFCPGGLCQRDPDVFPTGLVALEPLCECHYNGGPQGSVLSPLGLVCLCLLLLLVSVYAMAIRKRRFQVRD